MRRRDDAICSSLPMGGGERKAKFPACLRMISVLILRRRAGSGKDWAAGEIVRSLETCSQEFTLRCGSIFNTVQQGGGQRPLALLESQHRSPEFDFPAYPEIASLIRQSAGCEHATVRNWPGMKQKKPPRRSRPRPLSKFSGPL